MLIWKHFKTFLLFITIHILPKRQKDIRQPQSHLSIVFLLGTPCGKLARFELKLKAWRCKKLKHVGLELSSISMRTLDKIVFKLKIFLKDLTFSIYGNIYILKAVDNHFASKWFLPWAVSKVRSHFLPICILLWSSI